MHEFIKLNNFVSHFQNLLKNTCGGELILRLKGNEATEHRKNCACLQKKIEGLCSDLLLLTSECVDGCGQYDRCKPKHESSMLEEDRGANV